MSEDIFVPKSSPEDALVGPLHTVTYITSDKHRVEEILTQGYGLEGDDWIRPTSQDFSILNPYLGFDLSHTWEACAFNKTGAGHNGQVRVIHIEQDTPAVRPNYEGLYKGGATISFPMVDLHSHETRMADLGVESTVGVKELEFTAPTGETYVSAEIVYKVPDNVFLLGVKRPDIFIPVGPIDPATGIGGPAYSARCSTNTDAILAFLTEVLAYEIRRDTSFVVGDVSAINLPKGTTERFVQAFAPGANTGYLIFMDHGEVTKLGPADTLGPPSRGFGMWSFRTERIDEVYRRAISWGAEILCPPAKLDSPFLGSKQVMLMKDPDGYPIEVFDV